MADQHADVAPVLGLDAATDVQTVDGEIFETARARKIARRMFYWGFAFLPWLWLTNVWLFWHEFRGRPGCDPEVKKHTRWSAIGFTVASCIFIPWSMLYITAGASVLDPHVYWILDATRLNVAALGLPSS